jgi:hypothetical protein
VRRVCRGSGPGGVPGRPTRPGPVRRRRGRPGRRPPGVRGGCRGLRPGWQSWPVRTRHTCCRHQTGWAAARGTRPVRRRLRPCGAGRAARFPRCARSARSARPARTGGSRPAGWRSGRRVRSGVPRARSGRLRPARGSGTTTAGHRGSPAMTVGRCWRVSAVASRVRASVEVMRQVCSSHTCGDRSANSSGCSPSMSATATTSWAASRSRASAMSAMRSRVASGPPASSTSGGRHGSGGRGGIACPAAGGAGIGPVGSHDPAVGRRDRSGWSERRRGWWSCSRTYVRSVASCKLFCRISQICGKTAPDSAHHALPRMAMGMQRRPHGDGLGNLSDRCDAGA